MTTVKHSLQAEKRKIIGKKVAQLRKSSILPAHVFGQTESVSVQVDAKAFASMLAEAGETGIVYLQIEGEAKSRPVLISGVSYNPVSGDTLHVDFQQVNLSEAITANIPLELVGESEAVKAGNVLLTLLDEIEVEALPANLPEKFILSIDGLVEVGEELKVSDLQNDSETVKILIAPEEIIVRVQAPAEEEVEEPVDATEEIEITGGAAGHEKEEKEGDQPENQQQSETEEKK